LHGETRCHTLRSMQNRCYAIFIAGAFLLGFPAVDGFDDTVHHRPDAGARPFSAEISEVRGVARVSVTVVPPSSSDVNDARAPSTPSRARVASVKPQRQGTTSSVWTLLLVVGVVEAFIVARFALRRGLARNSRRRAAANLADYAAASDAARTASSRGPSPGDEAPEPPDASTPPATRQPRSPVTPRRRAAAWRPPFRTDGTPLRHRATQRTDVRARSDDDPSITRETRRDPASLPIAGESGARPTPDDGSRLDGGCDAS
jgi:type II secretory pathway pseudopilin PulG